MPKLKFQGRSHAHLRESNNLDMNKYCVAAMPGAWGHVRKPHVEVYMARSEWAVGRCDCNRRHKTWGHHLQIHTIELTVGLEGAHERKEEWREKLPLAEKGQVGIIWSGFI